MKTSAYTSLIWIFILKWKWIIISCLRVFKSCVYCFYVWTVFYYKLKEGRNKLPPLTELKNSAVRVCNEVWPGGELSSAAPAEPEGPSWRNEDRWGRSPADARYRPPPHSWAATCRRRRRPEGGRERMKINGEKTAAAKGRGSHSIKTNKRAPEGFVANGLGGLKPHHGTYLFDCLALGDLWVSNHLVWRADLNEGELWVLCNLSCQRCFPTVGWTCVCVCVCWEEQVTICTFLC